MWPLIFSKSLLFPQWIMFLIPCEILRKPTSTLLQAPETHLYSQEIVYLAKINDIVDHIFTGGLEMPNLMTCVGSHASTYPCAYYISAFKSWYPDSPLRSLNLYARQFGKWMKTWSNLFSCSKLYSKLEASPASFSTSSCKWACGLVASFEIG